MCRTLCDDNILLFWALIYFSGGETVHGQDWLVGIFGEMGRTYLLDLVIIGVDYFAEFLSMYLIYRFISVWSWLCEAVVHGHERGQLPSSNCHCD